MRADQQARSTRVNLGCIPERGTVLIQDGERVAKGIPLDLSQTGMFVEVNSPIFKLGQRVTVTVKIPNVIQPFSHSAFIVRKETDGRFSKGFGIQFDGTPASIFNFFGQPESTAWGEFLLLTEEQRSKKFLLVEMDKGFSDTFCDYAKRSKLNVDVVPHLGVFSSLKDIDTYDMLVVNYDLEPFSGLEVAEMLRKHLPMMPVIMLSATSNPWQHASYTPDNIVGIANKWVGVRRIVEQMFAKI